MDFQWVAQHFGTVRGTKQKFRWRSGPHPRHRARHQRRNQKKGNWEINSGKFLRGDGEFWKQNQKNLHNCHISFPFHYLRVWFGWLESNMVRHKRKMGISEASFMSFRRWMGDRLAVCVFVPEHVLGGDWLGFLGEQRIWGKTTHNSKPAGQSWLWTTVSLFISVASVAQWSLWKAADSILKILLLNSNGREKRKRKLS